MITYTNPIRILLIDDHPIVRSGLVSELHKRANLLVVDTATSAEVALKQLQQTAIDVVISDLYLETAMSGIQLLLRLHERQPTLPVLIMSSDERPATVRQVLGAGAAGFLSKRSSGADFADAIHWSVSPKKQTTRYVAPSDLRLRLDQQTEPTTSPLPDQAQALTRKEIQTLRAYGRGLEPKEIAYESKVAVTTVYSHLQNARQKLQIYNDVELRNFAINHLLTAND